MAINPTCAMMMRREYPELLPEALRPQARKLAELVRDPSELLWEIRNEPRFDSQFKSTPGGAVAYHAPCHLRAQGVGFKGRDLLRKIPGVTPKMTMECCGHDGTHAMKVEGFQGSIKVGQKAFDGMKAAEAEVWATECPLAALQFQQHAGKKPLHPMSILARAYREDGFAKKVEASTASRGAGAADGERRRRDAMKAIERSEILDYVSYEERRDALRASAMRAKDERRVHVGPYLTFLFENRETIRYQIQEMTRAERMVKEAEIRHEIETYNELLGTNGDLGCTLLIEIDDPAERAVKLARWLALPKHLYAKLEDGREGARDVRRAPGGRHAAVRGPVPQVPGGRPRAGRDRLRSRRSRGPRRDDPDGGPARGRSRAISRSAARQPPITTVQGRIRQPLTTPPFT